MSAGFVVALVEGFEGTLDVVLSRVLSPELRAAVVGLLSQVEAARGAIAELSEQSDPSCAGC